MINAQWEMINVFAPSLPLHLNIARKWASFGRTVKSIANNSPLPPLGGEGG